MLDVKQRSRLRVMLKKARRTCILMFVAGLFAGGIYLWLYEKAHSRPALGIGRGRLIRMQNAEDAEQLFEMLGAPGTPRGTNIRDAVALVAGFDYYYFAGASLLIIGSTLFSRSYDIVSMNAAKFMVWLACVLYICACVCAWIANELVAVDSVNEIKKTQVVLLTTAANVEWGCIYLMSLIQAYSYGMYFKPPPANSPDDDDDDDDDKNTKKSKKLKPWYNSGGWAKWWAFCRSLGHKDMTLATLYGSGSVIGFGTLLMSGAGDRQKENAAENKSMAIELSLAMVEVAWLLTAVHAGWFLAVGYANAVEEIDNAAKEERDAAKGKGKGGGKGAKKPLGPATEAESKKKQ